MTPFESNITSIYGKRGKRWLATIQDKVQEIADLWGLSDLKPFGNLSYNYVLSGLRGEQSVILKLGCDPNELHREASALRAFDGFGAVQDLEEREGALLVERARPGDSLRYTSDYEAIPIACNVMKRLHESPLPEYNSFPHLRSWLNLINKDWDIPELYLKKARELKDHLLETSPESVLLHGDLHHDNILKNGKDWVVIDPKGVIGDPLFEVGAFVRNPNPEILDQSIIEKRISTFAKCLNADEACISQWCFVGSVLSWIWGIEDGIDLKGFVDLPEIFYKRAMKYS